MNQATVPNGTDNANFEQTHRSGGYGRSLYRHPSNRVLAGVCGGLADWLGWDAVVVRILWLIFAVTTSGAGLFVYLLLALLLPVGTQVGGAVKRAPVETRLHSGKPLAFLLMSVGVLWLFSNLGILPELAHVFYTIFKLFFWPVVLIAIGWSILRALGVRMGNGDALRSQVDAWGARAATWSEQMRSSTSGVATSAAASSHAADAGSAQSVDASMLTRSASDRVLFGVCGGIAARYGIDPVLVRLLWALVTLATAGFGLFAYALAALLLPVEKAGAVATHNQTADAAGTQEIPIEGTRPVDF